MNKRKPPKRASNKTGGRKTKSVAKPPPEPALPESEDFIVTQPDLTRVTVPMAYAITAPPPKRSGLLRPLAALTMVCGAASLVGGFYADTVAWYSSLTLVGITAIIVGYIVWGHQ